MDLSDLIDRHADFLGWEGWVELSQCRVEALDEDYLARCLTTKRSSDTKLFLPRRHRLPTEGGK
jgi:hypothetical protein